VEEAAFVMKERPKVIPVIFCKLVQMKIAKRIACYVAGICFVLFLSGCAFTHAVTKIGKRDEFLQVHQILIATNGEVAIDCTASCYSSKSIGLDRWTSRIESSSKKYLVGTRNVVDWTVTNAALDPLYYRRNTRSHPIGMIVDTNTDKTNHVWVSQLIYGTTNSMSWRIVPCNYGGRDATFLDLPQEFSGAVSTFNGRTFPYEIKGQDFEMRLPVNIGSRKYRKWWGYPAQILIFPAFAIDIVTFPYQVYVVGKGISEIQG
jgi:hypothetical protein